MVFCTLCCVVQVGAFIYCVYRAFLSGRAYELHLREHCPVIAEKRRSDLFYRFTFSGMPVPLHLTGETELDDETLNRTKRAMWFYLIVAFTILCVPIFVWLVAKGLVVIIRRG